MYLVTANDVLQEYQIESSKVVVNELTWIDNKTIALSTLSSEDDYPRVYKDVLRFVGQNIADAGQWKVDSAINVLLAYGRQIADKSCESPTISKEEDANKYDEAVKDVITIRACPTHKVVSRSFNNNKPPIIRTEEVDLFSNKFQPPLGLFFGTPKAKIVDVLGNPDVSNSEINKMVYFGDDEGGCSSSINFILDKGILSEIRWGFCNE